MEMPDLQKLMGEMMAEHRDLMASHGEYQQQVIRLMERQTDIEAIAEGLDQRDKGMERLVKDVAENNIRMSRILEIHDYNIDELDARLKRIEERHRGPAPN